MNSLKALFLLFALVCVTSTMARDLKSPKSTKSPTMKSTKGPKMSKKTKSPSDTKGSKLSTKSPTLKSSKTTKKSGAVPPATLPPGGIPTLVFTGFGEDEEITEFNGLTVTGLRASNTRRDNTIFVKAGVPLVGVRTVTFTAPPGFTFSLVSVELAAATANDSVVIKGFDAGGTEISSIQIDDIPNNFPTYDISAISNVSRVTFTWSGPFDGKNEINAAIDELVFA
eukprot:scaffold6992_cov102-Cylindrotheca_fusiformis.AAC.7